METSARTGVSPTPREGFNARDVGAPQRAGEAENLIPVDQTLATARPVTGWERAALLGADVLLVLAAVAAVAWSVTALTG